MILGKTIEELRVGDSAEITQLITEGLILQFAEVIGDFNPIHIDEAYAQKTRFKGRIAHGALSIGFFSNLLGNILPGPGTIYLSHEIKFLAPIRIGDKITARVELAELLSEKNRAKFRTLCLNQHGEIVVDGFAWVMPPKK
jgi:3-hydroxybutyryl-CoA dehydratase